MGMPWYSPYPRARFIFSRGKSRLVTKPNNIFAQGEREREIRQLTQTLGSGSLVEIVYRGTHDDTRAGAVNCEAAHFDVVLSTDVLDQAVTQSQSVTTLYNMEVEREGGLTVVRRQR